MIGSARSWGSRNRSHVILAVIAVVVLQGLHGCEATRDEVTTVRLDADTRNHVLTEVAASIRDHYADREVGESLASTILAGLQQGQFDSVVDAETLVAEVMAVIRTKVADRHFDLAVRGEPDDRRTRPGSEMRSEHGLTRTGILNDNVAYLEFDGLPGDDASLSFVEQALAALPQVDALIIDVRDNHGGSGDMVVLLCGHLLEAGTLLYDYRDRSDNPPGEMKTGRYARTFGPEVPVYVLTSEATLSAAEALAYILQDYERATIIGEQTPGMANPSRTFSIGDDFTITIPFLLFGYGKNRGTFAGVGVVPDRMVPAESALDVALAEIGAEMQSREH